MTARSAAVARSNAEIDASQSRAIAARTAEQKPRNALEAMAGRLQVSSAILKDTLMRTVFSGCRNDEEFVALVLVANEYGLNPLTKEIYAFPGKGGIVPMVSIDGWIRLMNSHPQFDGIEFDYHNADDGGAFAVEAVIYRKDRTRPIKVMEYLDECKRGTEPWKQSPRRMLRHRALIQCVRIAFGFGGIAAEGEEDQPSGEYRDITPQRLPTRKSLAEDLDDEIPEHDHATGEIVQRDARGMSVVDDDVARSLDANDGTLSADNPAAGEDRSDEDHGDQHDGADDETPAWQAKYDSLMLLIEGASAKSFRAVDTEVMNHIAAFPDEPAAALNRELDAKRRALRSAD